ncbi:MAG: CIA30 family protein [Candidatus Latescibacteria bacterium]|nr:CIA30 family protein [Candidatus Latescibacterota bacterium]
MMLNPHSEHEPIVVFDGDAMSWHGNDDPIVSDVSRGEMSIQNGVGVFQGNVSLHHHGGFASVHLGPGELDLSMYAGLALRVRGDGKHYSLRLRTTQASDGANYQFELAPEAGTWHNLRLPFTAFLPVHGGHTTTPAPRLDPAAIGTIGLAISGRQEGPFRLELASIEGYRLAKSAGHGGLTVVHNTERSRADFRAVPAITSGDKRDIEPPMSRVSLFSNWMKND